MIRFLRNLFLDDFWLKLFSLILATLIWLTIYFAGLIPNGPLTLLQKQRTLQGLPVTIVSSDDDVRNLKVIPNTVTVLVEGNSVLMRELSPAAVRVRVDLSGIQVRESLRRRVEVAAPPGVAYLKVVPEEVQVYRAGVNQPTAKREE